MEVPNPILGWSKLLQTRKFDQEKTAYALATIERNAKLQSQLMEDLLDVSRILQNKLSLKISSVDLSAVIEVALDTVRLAAQAKSVQLKTKFEPNVGQVLGDPSRLQQVIWNLLSNAVKFTPSEGQVEIRLERVGTQAQIQVSDTGKGIEPEFLPHVFDYFRQADNTTTRTFGGLGLGLAIVRQIVELHGGTVQAESEGDEKGATFTVLLPIKSVEPQTSEDKGLPDASPNLQGVNVLVVDDEVDTRDLIVFILQQCGASVRAFASASQALNALAVEKPDILLSDIGMPEMDGYMLIRQIRSLPPEQGGEILAIALTAYAGETNEQEILQAGFQKHLTKPIEPGKLAMVIASLVK
ncbi:MAG: ATP-binding protein [Nostoc sp.]